MPVLALAFLSFYILVCLKRASNWVSSNIGIYCDGKNCRKRNNYSFIYAANLMGLFSYQQLNGLELWNVNLDHILPNGMNTLFFLNAINHLMFSFTIRAWLQRICAVISFIFYFLSWVVLEKVSKQTVQNHYFLFLLFFSFMFDPFIHLKKKFHKLKIKLP